MQNPSTFKVYNASAGSGKTFTLVKEYLKILLNTTDVNKFRNILAITFTNKAAAEMKARIISNLRDFANPEILKDRTEMFLQIEFETNLQESIIHQRSKKVLQSILFNYAAFNITTIDSFTYRLIRSFAFDLGLSLNFDVEMDTKSLLNEAVDVLISKIGEDIELTKILIDFSLQKANEDKSWDISRELKEIAQILLNENDLLHVQNLKNKSLKDFVELKTNLQKKLKIIESQFVELGKEGLKIIDSFEINYKDFYYSQFPKHFQFLINDTSKLNFDSTKGLAKSIENRQFYTKGKPEEIKTTIDSIINPLLELYKKSKELFKEYSLYKLFSNSLIPLAVLNKINQSLDELKEEKNIRLNAEFNQIISEHLRAQPAAFIYERIGEKYKHYFIDEMQDTSKLQWQNLIPLIANALSQENSSLMLVGDAKQSIYRWRGGKAEQFIGLSNDENPFFIEKEQEYLDVNHRSYSEIINFNNSFFQFLSKYLKKEKYASIYKQENQQKITNKIGGYVNLSFIEEGLLAAEKDEIYPKKVLHIVTDLKGKFDLNEICVLTRTRKQGVVIANYLTENGIAIISSETLLLQNSEKVKFIINLISFLQQQNNKEIKLKMLYFLYDHLEIKTDKHDFLSNHINLKTEEFFRKLCNYNLDFNYSYFNQLPFYESIEAIVRGFRLTQNSDAYLQFFLDEILQYTIKKSDGVQGFLNYWEEKKDKLSIVVPEEKNAVRIMTIHKSKGLEFPVVIFPYDLDIYRELNPKAWYPVKEKEQLNNFNDLLVNVNKSLELTGKTGREIVQKRKDELELDNINLLYVTLTRAVEQLYIISEKRKQADEPKWYSQFFIAYLKQIGDFDEQEFIYEFGQKNRVSKKKKTIQNSYELEQFISSPWQDHNINIVATSGLLWNSEKGASVLYGNLIHEILSKIKTKIDIDDAIEYYIINGIIATDKVESIVKIVRNVVKHPRLDKYFQQNITVYNEREILSSDKEIVIPDRFVIDENNQATIIDYKTGKPTKKYHNQLYKYELAIKELGISVKEKLLVYIDHESIEIEEVH